MYTLPSGKRATPKQERERLALLEARRECQDCKKAVRRDDWSMGACQCVRHQS